MKNILSDKRYKQLVSVYHADPLAFAVNVCGMSPSDDQAKLHEAIAPQNAKVSVVSGTGCFALGTEIMLSNGKVLPVEHIAVGDKLMGDNGNSERNVLELRRGSEMMYEFTYGDGSTHKFNESHILCLIASYDKNKVAKGTKLNVTVKDWLTWTKTKKKQFKIYRNKVDNFFTEKKKLLIDPYILGVWLGDGTKTLPEFSISDSEIMDEIKIYSESIGCLYSQADKINGYCRVVIKRKKGTAQKNVFKEKLKTLNLINNKHVPIEYLTASYNDRCELLAGLIDTDGHFDKSSGGFEITQKIKQVAESIVWLAKSIGCHAVVNETWKSCQTFTEKRLYYRVYIGRGIDKIPVRTERRKDDGRRRHVEGLRFTIKSCEAKGIGDYYGFILDGNRKFLGGDFTVLHNTGKTNAFARIAFWHLVCFPFAYYDNKLEIGSNTYIGAPRISQVSDGVWKEMADTKIAISNTPYAWLNDYIEITKTKVYIKGFSDQWFISQVAMQQGQSIGVAGKHRYWQLIIIDEAAGVSDDHFDVIDGTQTQGGNRTLMASQGVRNTGRFYESHSRLSKAKGGSWTPLVFNSERSPFVTNQWLKDRATETGGRNSIEYRIRVLGQFAVDSSNNLLSVDDIEQCFTTDSVIANNEPYGIMILSDIGLGEYRDDSTVIIAKVTGTGDFGENARRVDFTSIPICTNSRNEINIAGDIVGIMGKQSNPTLLVDNGGVGATITKLIEASGVNVHRVNWGKPCFKRAYKERFYNQRAQSMVCMRDAIRDGRVSITADMDIQLREKIILQGSRLPFHFAENGGLRYQMDRKEVMRSNGISSPDLFDAMAFAFLEDAHYIESENSNLAKYTTVTMSNKLDDAFSQIL